MTWWFFKRFLLSKRSGSLARVISILCISGIGLGVFALIVVMSVMNGFNQAIRERLLSVEPHLVVTFKDGETSEKWTEWQSRFLSKNPEVLIYPFERQDVILKTIDGYFSGAQARGLDSETLAYMLSRMAKGDKDREFQVPALAESEILIGSELARSLQVFEEDVVTAIPPEGLLLPPGVAPKIAKLTVRGFISTFISDIDSHTLYYIRGKNLAGFGKTASYQSGVELMLPDPMDFAVFKKEIIAAGFEVESWKDRNAALFRALMMERTLIGIFLILSTVIASFSIVTVLALLLTQKQREFGMLMSMGLSPRHAQRVFAKLGVLLALCGMGGGLIAGTIVSLYIEKNPLNVLPAIYQDSRIPALVDFKFILFIACGAICISLLAAWYPSRQISLLQPAEALRFKR